MKISQIAQAAFEANRRLTMDKGDAPGPKWGEISVKDRQRWIDLIGGQVSKTDPNVPDPLTRAIIEVYEPHLTDEERKAAPAYKLPEGAKAVAAAVQEPNRPVGGLPSTEPTKVNPAVNTTLPKPTAPAVVTPTVQANQPPAVQGARSSKNPG